MTLKALENGTPMMKHTIQRYLALAFSFAALSSLVAISSLTALARPVQARTKEPFTGTWISKQYTNGREFQLKIKQNKDELIAWEGRIASGTEPAPDLHGRVNGKTVDLEITHRRGYKGRAILSLRGEKLVWQMTDGGTISSKYFPIASTLLKQDETSGATTVAQKKKELQANKNVSSSSATNSQDKKMPDKVEILISVLKNANSFQAERGGLGAESALFGTYQNLLAEKIQPDNPFLQDLLKNGSPGGKLYAACILWEHNKEDGIKAFNLLSSDKSKVTYSSGCEASHETVDGIAKSIIERGSFLDFPLKKY